MNTSLTLIQNTKGVQTSLSIIVVTTEVFVGIGRTNNEEIADGRVVRNLFTINLGAILEFSLKSFTQDRIQGLEESVGVVERGNGSGNDNFESFQGVGFHGGSVHVEGE